MKAGEHLVLGLKRNVHVCQVSDTSRGSCPNRKPATNMHGCSMTLALNIRRIDPLTVLFPG